MPFRLLQSETLSDGVRRIACEEIGQATTNVASMAGDVERAVHNARTSMKRLRALLRMIRVEIGAERFRHDDALFRSIGRRLAARRDRAVIGKTLKDLRESFPEEFDEPTARHLTDRFAATDETILPDDAVRVDMMALLHDAEDRVAEWKIEGEEFRVLQGGIRMAYRRARRGYAEVVDDPGPEVLHSWRRQVKYVWHMLRILTPLWPRAMKCLTTEYRILSEKLGDDHDLMLLRTLLTTMGQEDSPLVALVDRRRATLLGSALPIGARLFAERSGPFVDRLRLYWKLWRM